MAKKKSRTNEPAAPESVHTEPLKLTQFAHGGGCGCKIAPNVLEQILTKTVPAIVPKQLLVGIETSDDAAVYQLNADQALVATTDFFMPIVDDPFDFGCIAATNALSDVYAMGGVPLLALAIVGMPVNKLPLETIKRILEGGESICAKAGIPIAGGHTIDSIEPIYGLVAIGLVHPDNLKRNSGARPGDKLILGKGLGVGFYSAALKKGLLSASHYAVDDRFDDAAQHAGTGARLPGRRTCDDRRDRLRPARSPGGNLQGIAGLGGDRLRGLAALGPRSRLCGKRLASPAPRSATGSSYGELRGPKRRRST
jgi:antitoxin (DNA-binding transcriptional repressor) of toxin-antitoxin stability system